MNILLQVNVPRDENGKMLIEVDEEADVKDASKKEKLFPELETTFYISSKIPSSYLEDLRLFYCYVCEKNIEGELTFVVHMKTHLVPRRLSCMICMSKFDDDDDFRDHMASHFDEEGNIIVVEKIADTDDDCLEKCRVCSEVFLNQAERDKHVAGEKSRIANQDKAVTKSMIRSVDAITYYVQKYIDLKSVKESNQEERSQSWPFDWLIAERHDLKRIFEWCLKQTHGPSCAHPRVQSRFAYNYFICPYCHVFLKNNNVMVHMNKHVSSD